MAGTFSVAESLVSTSNCIADNRKIKPRAIIMRDFFCLEGCCFGVVYKIEK